VRKYVAGEIGGDDDFRAERAIDSIQEAIHILAPAPSEPAAAVEKMP